MREINWNDTVDTGAESVRLGVDAAKKGRRAVRTARGTTRTAVRAAKTTVNILHHLIVHTVAILISPVTWVILAIGLVLYLLMTLLIILTGVAAQDNNAQHQAYATPVALGEDIPEEITEAKGLFETAVNAKSANTRIKLTRLCSIQRICPTMTRCICGAMNLLRNTRPRLQPWHAKRSSKMPGN